jgi:hypothetical protein
VVQDANPQRCRRWRTVERGREQPPRERRETRGRANEIGLGLGAQSGGAGLYIGREGRPDPTVTGRGGRDPTAIVPGACRPLERVVPVSGWRVENSVQHGHGGRAVPGTSTGRPGRFVLRPCLIGLCSCRANGLSPFEHL